MDALAPAFSLPRTTRSTAKAPGLTLHSEPHPLRQLSVAEIERAANVCRAHVASLHIPIHSIRFNTLMLKEPAKASLLSYEAGRGPCPPRQALCIVMLPTERVYAVEAVVSLAMHGTHSKDEMHSWKELPGLHPMSTPDEAVEAEEVVLADSKVRQLLAERYGVHDVSKVIVDAWALHGLHGVAEEFQARRLLQGFLYLKLSPHDNEYAHPIDMVPLIDMNALKVIHIDMYEQPSSVPLETHNYHRDLQTQGLREDVMPLHITQPLGPSFTVDGELVTWQKWRFRLGFNAREGMVLHNVGFVDAGRLRPILHRLSLVEMAVPYGDPSYPYIRKCAFDVGDYGFGFSANSLELGCDCLGHIHYFDAILNNAAGEGIVRRKAVCMHEEDAGVAWKHTDMRTGHAEVRRGRRLVISMIATFANYEYANYIYLYQDGTITYELKLTGILSTSVSHEAPGEGVSRYGIRVAPHVNATVHQHFFNVRIDPAMDDENGGRDLVISEVEAKAVPLGPDNPARNGFYMADTELLSTAVAQREHNFDTARFWKIKNPYSINPITQLPVAYKLLPAPSPVMMAQPGSLVAERALFATKHLWVTPFHDEQKYPAGDHVVQSLQCMGLKEWTQQDTSLVGADPVLWYSFGITHAPRIEDFPVMPVEVTSFALKPAGFFTQNPTLDLPYRPDGESREHGVGGRSGGNKAAPCCMIAPSRM